MDATTCDGAPGAEVAREDFPDGFVFGSATAAFQVEGGRKKDNTGLCIWDVFCETKGNILDGSDGVVAVDQYHRYVEDVDLMAKLGFGAYRFSISWTRIFPDGFGTVVNEKGIAYYNNLIDALLKKGIQPFATLYHWDLPYCLYENIGGWLTREIVEQRQREGARRVPGQLPTREAAAAPARSPPHALPPAAARTRTASARSRANPHCLRTQPREPAAHSLPHTPLLLLSRANPLRTASRTLPCSSCLSLGRAPPYIALRKAAS